MEESDPSCKVRLTGVTWYGMQSTNWTLAGLNYEPYQKILQETRDLGFNSIRIPLSDELVVDNLKLTIKPKLLSEQKPSLGKIHPLQLLDDVVHYAASIGLMVILDNHFSRARPASDAANDVAVRSNDLRSGKSRMASSSRQVRRSSGVINNTIWGSGISEAQWIADWKNLATRYKNDSNVIGFDLRNEPHTNYQHHRYWTLQDYLTAGATWGRCTPALCKGKSSEWKPSSDWVTAAEKAGDAIQQINAHVLLFVEGVQLYPDPHTTFGVETYWWGSILKGVATDPVHFTYPNHLVYSPHEWGPWKCCADWFNKRTTYASIAKIFNANWGYILTDKNVEAPIWLGEFNTCNWRQLHPVYGHKIKQTIQCVTNTQKGTQGQWFQILLEYLRYHPEISWSYYPLNGTNAHGDASNNSILGKYWVKPRLPALMDALKTIEKQPAK